MGVKKPPVQMGVKKTPVQMGVGEAESQSRHSTHHTGGGLAH